MNANFYIIIICLLIFTGCTSIYSPKKSEDTIYTNPQRENGFSLYMHPQCVAIDTGEPEKWGFVVKSSITKEKWITFKSPEKLIKYYKSLPGKTQMNGIWITTTNPSAYSEKENDMLNNLKQMCINCKIPLFLCRASELPSGWKECGYNKQDLLK